MTRVLVVDDDKDLLAAMCSLLAESGYEVAGVNDGHQAIAALREKPVDVLITDVMMPEVDGIELLCGARDEFPNVEVIAISGSQRALLGGFLKIASRLGARRTLIKPFDGDKLVQAVRELSGQGGEALGPRNGLCPEQ